MTRTQLLGWFVATAREWSWRHTGIGVLVGTLALSNMGGALFFGPDFPWLRSWIYNVFEFGVTYVFALRVADRAVAEGLSRWWSYGVAMVLVLVLGVWVIGPLLLPLIGGDPEWSPKNDVALFTSLLLPYSIATVAYANWRREQDTLQRVRSAELGRARQEQLVQSARLLALQARVEPQFLFDALQRMRNLFEQSAETAEQRLSDLIALLRAMQPAAGATASTLAREFALVEAYARAGELPALRAPRLKLEALGDATHARFAPLVLLPALRRLVGDAPTAAWQVGALHVEERLRLVIAPAEPDEHASAALASFAAAELGERLAAVHGPDARLAVAMQPSPALHIDLPFQTDESGHDQSPDR